jgi:hypothetical protein
MAFVGNYYYVQSITSARWNSNTAGNGKGHPMTCLGRHRWEGYSSNPFKTSTLERVGWSAPRAASCTPQKAQYTLHMRLGGPQDQFEQAQKISLPTGFDPRAIQHIAHHYTDYAIPAARNISDTWQLLPYTFNPVHISPGPSSNFIQCTNMNIADSSFSWYANLKKPFTFKCWKYSSLGWIYYFQIMMVNVPKK